MGVVQPMTLQLFLYLQLLDLLTTVLGFKLGAVESSPFIRLLMHAGPVTGVALSKVLALGVGMICVYTRRYRPLHWITAVSGLVVAWNLSVILATV